jgi:2-desacetyl-2-hydroxyethyl bacteriochlorophyllide A dehydrogenase
MKAAQLRATNDFAVVQLPIPVRKDGEVLVKVLSSGICGTDRHIVKGEFPSDPPYILGHEFGGLITEVGANSKFKVGDKVTVDPNIYCGKCSYCRNGQVSFCTALSAHGVHRDGGLAEYATVPESQIYVLAPTVPDNHLAFCEPIGCCLRGIDLAKIEVGQSVAILGGGVVGMLMVQFANLAGATTIIMSTRQKARRELAEKLGATHSIDPVANKLVDSVAGPSGIVPLGVDVVLECAGTVETFQGSLEIAKRGGTIIVFGVTPAGAFAQVKPFDIMSRELRIQGSWINPFTHGRAADIVSSGILQLDPLISRVLSLDEVPGIFENPPVQGDIKYIVNPSR